MTILFKPKINVSIGNVVRDKNGRYILSETVIDDLKFIFVNIYAPNDPAQQVKFLRDLPNSVLNSYANESLVIGGDFKCPLNDLDKRGGRTIEHKKIVIQEMNNLMKTYDLIDTWQFKSRNVQGCTWSNPSMKSHCRLDYFLLAKDFQSSLKSVKIVPNVFSDHSALSLVLALCEKKAERGPGFWKSNNSLLADKEYIKLISEKIPEFASKYHDVTDKGFVWELIKMEIRATSIAFSKRKAQQQRDEEKKLTQISSELQEKMRLHFSEETKAEIDHAKNNLSKVIGRKTQGAMVRSRAGGMNLAKKKTVNTS